MVHARRAPGGALSRLRKKDLMLELYSTLQFYLMTLDAGFFFFGISDWKTQASSGKDEIRKELHVYCG